MYLKKLNQKEKEKEEEKNVCQQHRVFPGGHPSKY